MIHLNNYFNYDPTDCLTPEEEAKMDARYEAEQVENWLAAWFEDFWSDEWAASLPDLLVG